MSFPRRITIKWRTAWLDYDHVTFTICLQRCKAQTKYGKEEHFRCVRYQWTWHSKFRLRPIRNEDPQDDIISKSNLSLQLHQPGRLISNMASHWFPLWTGAATLEIPHCPLVFRSANQDDDTISPSFRIEDKQHRVHCIKEATHQMKFLFNINYLYLKTNHQQ